MLKAARELAEAGDRVLVIAASAKEVQRFKQELPSSVEVVPVGQPLRGFGGTIIGDHFAMQTFEAEVTRRVEKARADQRELDATRAADLGVPALAAMIRADR